MFPYSLKLNLVFKKSAVCNKKAFTLPPYFKIGSPCTAILSMLSKGSFPWFEVAAAAKHSGWLLSIPLKQMVGT